MPTVGRGETQGASAPGRSYFVALLAVAVLLGCGLLAAIARVPAAPLPPGSPMPALSLTDWRSGERIELRAITDPTVVILVRSGCQYCARQLGDISAHFNDLAGARFLMVTAEEEPPRDYPERWNVLARSPDVIWARAPSASVASTLHTMATPSIYIFGRDARLRRSFRGLTGVGVIAREVTSALGRPH